MIKKKVRAFTSRFVNFIYFSSSKTHFSTLAIIFYNIPHIPLFILQYIQLKYYKIILFFFSIVPTTPTLETTKPLRHKSTTPTPATQNNYQTHLKTTTKHMATQNQTHPHRLSPPNPITTPTLETPTLNHTPMSVTPPNPITTPTPKTPTPNHHTHAGYPPNPTASPASLGKMN